MRTKPLILWFMLGFLFIHPIFPTEFNWGDEHKIIIRPVSNFVSELKIIETKTNKLIHESLTGMKHVIKAKRKKIEGKDIFFIQATTGGEGIISSNLYYFYIEAGELKQGVVEDIIEFSLRDLDKDKNKELILTDFKYYKFKINRCINTLEPDPHYTGKLLPTIYKLKQNKFLEESNNELLENYRLKLEKKLLKKKKFKNLNGYSHYFAISKKLGLEKQALTYFKANNSNFNYSCENTMSENPKGRSFKWKTNYYSFFKKYGKQIY